MPTNWTNITTPAQMLAIPNTATSNWFYPAMLITLFVIILVSLMNYTFEKAILVASWTCAIVSMLFVFAGLLHWMWFLFFLAPMILWTIFAWTSSKTV
jgi:hypothetical protein